MVTKKYLFLFILVSFFSCEKKLFPLEMEKTSYTGNGLRTDGYYYSDIFPMGSNGLAIFNQNGVCFHLFHSSDTTQIEQEILLDDEFMEELRTTPTNIGVFQITGESIEFEIWESVRTISTYNYFGEILNDTTFILREHENLQKDLMEDNITYRFKQFSSKPDSTSTFIP